MAFQAVDARVGVQEGTDQQPSHAAIDNGNPSTYKAKIFALDDINVDLISVILTVGTLASILALGLPALPVLLAGSTATIALRSFFPRPTVPQGLALITGASSGIGAELSYILAEKGHDLILVGRNEEQLDAVKRNVKEKYDKIAYTIATDLSIPGSAKQLYEHVVQQGFKVEILVNSAGLGGVGDPFDQPIELAERMITLNCVALTQLTQLFARDMIQRGRGWMLQVSSVGGWMVSPGQNIYHATKHYVRAFSEALSLELRDYPGVINTQLMPGPTQTQFITRAHAEETIMMSASGAVEDAKAVAMAGYKGLCKGKRMVFSSWNAAFTATMMHLAPRSVHLTMAAIMNSPTRGVTRATEPEKDQNVRGQDLKEKK